MKTRFGENPPHPNIGHKTNQAGLTVLTARPDCLSTWLPCQPGCLVSLAALSATALPSWQPGSLAAWQPGSLAAWEPCQPLCLDGLPALFCACYWFLLIKCFLWQTLTVITIHSWKAVNAINWSIFLRYLCINDVLSLSLVTLI